MRGKGKGDLYVVIRVQMPKKLTKAQKQIVSQLADAGL
jgi:DnaJ-class molecular chaperone